MRLQYKLAAGLVSLGMILAFLSAAAWAGMPPYGPERNDYVAYLRVQADTEAMEFWRGGAPMVTVADIEQYLARFGLWATVAHDARKYKLVAAEEALLADFEARAKSIQAEMLPKLRLALENVPPESYGKANVVLRTEGDGARQAVFVGREFTPDKGGSFFDEGLYRLLQQLRFTSASYEVLDNGSSSTETMFLQNQPLDNALVIWNSATGRLRIVE